MKKLPKIEKKMAKTGSFTKLYIHISLEKPFLIHPRTFQIRRYM